MIALLKCCYLVLIIVMVGDVVNGIIFKERFKSSASLRFSLAYGFGTGTLSLALFYLSYFGITISLFNLFILTLPFQLYFISTIYRNREKLYSIFSFYRFHPKFNLIEYLLMFLIVLSLVLITFKALFLPTHLADDRAQIGIKGKILYYDKSIYSEDFFDPLRVKYHVSYPFLVPLLECSFYLFLGEINDSLVKMPFPLFFASMLLFFYACQRQFSCKGNALLFTTMLAVLPSFIKDVHGNPSSGYADVPLTFYYTIAAISLFWWISKGKIKDLILASLFITFALFTKRDATVLCFIMLLVFFPYYFIARRESKFHKLISLASFIGIPTLILTPWFLFKSTFNLPPWEMELDLSYMLKTFTIHSDRILPTLLVFKKTFMGVNYWGILGILLLISLGFSLRNSFSVPQVFLLIMIFLNLLVLFVAVVSFPYRWWYGILHDIPRLAMVNIPLVIYFISFQFKGSGLHS